MARQFRICILAILRSVPPGQRTASGSGVLARVPMPGDGDLELLRLVR